MTELVKATMNILFSELFITTPSNNNNNNNNNNNAKNINNNNTEDKKSKTLIYPVSASSPGKPANVLLKSFLPQQVHRSFKMYSDK